MATQAEMYTGGVCFMNHPMKFGEEVHIRGKHTSLELRQKQILEIGLKYKSKNNSFLSE